MKTFDGADNSKLMFGHNYESKPYEPEHEEDAIYFEAHAGGGNNGGWGAFSIEKAKEAHAELGRLIEVFEASRPKSVPEQIKELPLGAVFSMGDGQSKPYYVRGSGESFRSIRSGVLFMVDEAKHFSSITVFSVPEEK